MGCKVCTELLQSAMDAVKAHLEASSQISEAVIGGNRDIDQLEKVAADCRESKQAAMKCYQDHLASHRIARHASASSTPLTL